MDLVSIIMPACKAEAHIARSVRSVLAQTYNKWELVIISDDGQDYAGVLEAQEISDSRIKHVSTGKMRAGVSTARNIGLRAAAGDLIAILDTDDEFKPDKLEYCVPKVVVAGLLACALEICDAQGKFLRNVGAHCSEGLVSGADYKFASLSMDSMIMFDRKKIPARYDESTGRMQDMEFILQCFTHTDVAYFCSKSLHRYFKMPTSESHAIVAGPDYTVIKNKLRERINDGYYTFKNPDDAKGFLRFLDVSLKTEAQFGAEKAKNPAVLFEDVLEKNMSGGPCRT